MSSPNKWDLDVQTNSSGVHSLTFDSQAEAEAALDEVMKILGSNPGPHKTPVKIAGRLIVIDVDIATATVHPSYTHGG